MGLKQDRVKAAMLDGTAVRWAGHFRQGRWDGDEVEALAELRAITTDPAIYTLAAAGLVGSDRGNASAAAELLARGGADLDEARRIRAARGPGFNPPQADPGRDRAT